MGEIPAHFALYLIGPIGWGDGVDREEWRSLEVVAARLVRMSDADLRDQPRVGTNLIAGVIKNLADRKRRVFLFESLEQQQQRFGDANMTQLCRRQLDH